jgi:hypothetical protein
MIGLTQNLIVAHNLATGNALPVGHENLCSIGVNTPRTFAVFLCLPFFLRLFAVTSLWQVALGGLTAGWLPIPSILTPNSTCRPSHEKLDRWFTFLSIGVTA